jgi:hypothetical protein
VAETRTPSIFDPPSLVPEAPASGKHGAISGFLASMNFGRARRSRAKTASHIIAPMTILLVGQLLLHGSPLDRADARAADCANSWYDNFESRLNAPRGG